MGRPRAASSEKVLAVAHDLFRRQGYAETSMQAIAEAAGISRTSLFSYFTSKSDLVWSDFEASLAILSDALDRRPYDESILVSLERGVSAMSRFGDEHRELLAFRWELTEHHPELQAAAQHLRAVMIIAQFIADRRGEAATDFFPMVVSQAVYAACTAASRCWTSSSSSDRLVVWVQRAIGAVLEGFRDELECPAPSVVRALPSPRSARPPAASSGS